MANLKTHLTDAICSRARPGPREYALRDERQACLSLRVRPSGTKTWEVRERSNGLPVRSTLGTFPAMGVKAARMAAVAFLAGDRKPARQSVTFRELCAQHELRHAAKLKPSGLRAYRSYVRLQLLPAFGSCPIDTITRRDVVSWFERYGMTSPGGANRALGILSQMLTSAQRWDMLPPDWSNPAVGIRLNRRRAIGTFLSRAQMARLGSVLTRRSNIGCPAAGVLEALLLTGCRVGEILSLRWEDVRPDRLRLRDSKTGARDVPMGTAARRFFTSYRRRRTAARGRHKVFQFGGAVPYERVRTVWLSVRKEAHLPGTLRIHDLRHSFASHAIMAGESLFTVSRLLGHKRIQTTARYAHLADDTLRASAERIGMLILDQVEPSTRRRKEPTTPTKTGGGAS